MILFYGLTHIGQVYSCCWANNFGHAAVFDPDDARLEDFSRGKLTSEEPGLDQLYNRVRGNIAVVNNPSDLANLKIDTTVITFDTPLNPDGSPEIAPVFEMWRKAFNDLNDICDTFVLVSQVLPGSVQEFCIANPNIVKGKRIFYWVDTLRMGDAVERFNNPPFIALGTRVKEDLSGIFLECLQSKWCEKVKIISWIEAEIIKSAVNLYLSISVSYANALNEMVQSLEGEYSNIEPILRLDDRIGQKSYIKPSLGIGGGHLERDLNYAIKIGRDRKLNSTSFWGSIKELQEQSIFPLLAWWVQIKADELSNCLWVGPSYKKESWSLVNAPICRFLTETKIPNIWIYEDIFEFDIEKEHPCFRLFNSEDFPVKKNIQIVYSYSSFGSVDKFCEYFKSATGAQTISYFDTETLSAGVLD
jgi:UDPglucose 6-dehydrogenase